MKEIVISQNTRISLLENITPETVRGNVLLFGNFDGICGKFSKTERKRIVVISPNKHKKEDAYPPPGRRPHNQSLFRSVLSLS